MQNHSEKEKLGSQIVYLSKSEKKGKKFLTSGEKCVNIYKSPDERGCERGSGRTPEAAQGKGRANLEN